MGSAVEGHSGRWRVWAAVAAALLPLVCLVPFVDKAFHIDDPVYLWVARQIRQHPADFFGFRAIWYTRQEPMYDINKNPPGVSYGIAAASALLGENERRLHAAFLIPACALSLGVYLLAQRLTRTPLLAAAIAAFAPVVPLASSNLMCDTPMTALYVWAVWMWMAGLEKRSYALLILAALTMAASALTKYFGASLIPLLFFYTLGRDRRITARLLPLAIPAVLLILYQLYTYRLYGTGMIGEAASFATHMSANDGWHLFSRPLTCLTFTGGCLLVAACYTPWPQSRRGWMWLALVAAVIVAGIFGAAGEKNCRLFGPDGVEWGYFAQWLLFALAGCAVLAMTVYDLWQCRDADAFLLGAWVFGTFAFAAFINWTVAGRTILPMTPAVAILAVRRIERDRGSAFHRHRILAWAPILPSALLAFALMYADARMAYSAQAAAAQIHSMADRFRGTIWYTGGWGFQWYMDAIGAHKAPRNENCAHYGDWIVIPHNNFFTDVDAPPDVMRMRAILTMPTCTWCTTMHGKGGAGFYASGHGPLPYVFGPAPPEQYTLYQIVPPRQAG